MEPFLNDLPDHINFQMEWKKGQHKVLDCKIMWFVKYTVCTQFLTMDFVTWSKLQSSF